MNSFFDDYEEQLFSDKIEAKAVLKKLGKCPIHNKAVSVTYDYDNHGTNAYVTRYCCQAFAETVAQALEETCGFTSVYIEKK